MTKNLILVLCAALAAEAFAEFKLSERQVLPVRDRFEVKSLNGSWDFVLGEKCGRINVPGNWATQGWKIPQYDKNRACVTMWTFGNENHVTTNIHEVLAYAARRDPTRPKGLPQIGEHFIKNYLHAPDENQELQMAHYLRGERLEKAARAADPLAGTATVPSRPFFRHYGK